jgi:hypothetical protein
MKIIVIPALAILVVFGFLQGNSFAQQLPTINPSNTYAINGSNIGIPYDVTGGKLLSINADSQSKSLIILLQPTYEGKLTVKLPRALIDAQVNGADTHFVVYLDGHGINYAEAQNFRYRILSIPFHNQSEKITITGTQMSLLNTTQSQYTANSNMHNDKKQETITASFTMHPPIIDGKWTTQNEWDTTTAVALEQNKTKMYIIAEHDQNFIYVIADIVTDHATPLDANLVQIGMIMIFDMDNYTGDFPTSKDIKIETGNLFINGTKIKSSGSEVRTYDEQGNSIALTSPQGYNSNMSLSSTNDPFDPINPHRIYEFKIPKSVLHSETRYGFSLDAYTCLGTYVNLCHSNDALWPSNTIMSIPSTHGLLELSTEQNHIQTFDFVSLAEIITIVIAISIVAVYFVKIKKRGR